MTQIDLKGYSDYFGYINGEALVYQNFENLEFGMVIIIIYGNKKRLKIESPWGNIEDFCNQGPAEISLEFWALLWGKVDRKME